MALQAFSFPLPETRFFKAGSFIYKFKIRGGASYREEDVMVENSFDQELEDIIRTVLGNLDSLRPFSSTHFTVFPYKKQWRSVWKHDEKNLHFYPFILIIYLEKNMHHLNDEDDHTSAGRLTEEEKKSKQLVPSVSEPPSKRCKTDSPLEDAIIKALINDMEAEGKVIVTGACSKVDHKESEVRGGPGYTGKKQCGTSGEVHPGTTQSTSEEEEETPAAPAAKPGILTQLASHIFPFSLFFKKH